MLLRLSRFAHLIPVGSDRMLVIDAISHVRLVVDRAVAHVIQSFAEPRDVAVLGPLTALVEHGILTDKTPEDELAHVANVLSPVHGRDPAALLERFRREAKEGPDPYWAASKTLRLDELGAAGLRIDVVLFGDCDVHMESDFMRREAAARGLDLRVAATFPDDLRFAGEHKHDAIIIGALRGRHLIVDDARREGVPPHGSFIHEAREIIEGLRKHSAAPILIDNLPEPTVQPLGLAERGAQGHRNRFRVANMALANLVESYADVHVVDIAAGLNAIGNGRMVDDGLVGFTHFGSPGWLLQRPEDEKAAVHGIFPDTAPLAQWVGGDPYAREAVTARVHLDVLVTVLGFDRKKCVIVDLDGVLWPGVLAETGAPFAWELETSGAASYVGLYFGLHEALLCLKKRGLLLACVSKNDEATVRALWKYQDHYPREQLLTPDDFVTWRVNWDDKVENIRSIADQLGFALDTFLFIDDNPVERERVRQRIPEVEVWGEDLFGLRRRLLSDPRLQLPRLTGESAMRTELTKAQFSRQSARAESPSESDFVVSLNVQTEIDRLSPGADVARISELFQRTTQFNTTGIKFPISELEALLREPDASVFAIRVKDRFGDHGLSGAAVIRRGEIVGLVMSCRVLGLGVEHIFIRHIVDALSGTHDRLSARIVPTERNTPVRHIYRDNGFAPDGDGVWRRMLRPA
jgi:FkbH-like protein